MIFIKLIIEKKTDKNYALMCRIYTYSDFISLSLFLFFLRLSPAFLSSHSHAYQTFPFIILKAE